MNKYNSIFLLIILLLLASCEEKKQDHQSGEVQQTVETEENHLSLSKEQLEYADIELGSIQSHSLSEDVQARGQLILPVNAMADMASLYPGTIKKVYVDIGDKVKMGQLLASVNSIDFIETQQQYLMVLHQIGMLEQEYERQKELNVDKISSDKYYQRARADYHMALTELDALKLQLNMAGVDVDELMDGNIAINHDIISPIDGYMENVFVNPGKYVNPDESLFQIINRDHLIIELNVFEKDIEKVREGQRITFTLSNMSDQVHEARIASVGNTVREDARVVRVLAEFINESGRLLPGMFVASEIHTDESEVAALPEEAVIRVGNDEYIIFYTLPEMQEEMHTRFDFAEVKIGNAEDGHIEIELLSPIPENAMIVISGGYYLKTEMAKQEE